MNDPIDLQGDGFSIHIDDFTKAKEVVDKINAALEELHSRALRSQVEAIIAGTQITIEYAVDWIDSKMVGIGLKVPGYNGIVRCQNYQEAALEWVQRWVDTPPREEKESKKEQT